MYKKLLLILIPAIALVCFSFSGEKSNDFQKDDSQNNFLREKHIDITVTSTNGCTFHIVGTVNYTFIPPKITGFSGTVTIGGPGSCPHQSFTINYVAFKTNAILTENKTDYENDVDVMFNTDVLCDLTSATWAASDQETSDMLNYSGISERLVETIKEGECY